MMNAHSGLLSVSFDDEKRGQPRRLTRLEATVSCVRSGLRGYRSQKAIILNLSESGCMVSCSAADELTNDVHIVITGLSAKIGCTVVGRTAMRLNLQFTEMLPVDVIDRLVARRI